MTIRWQHAGKHAEAVNRKFMDYPEDSGVVDIDGDPYLIRSFHLVPYYKPAGSDEAKTKRRRERLNVELCDRVFRISDVRDVMRRDDKADAAIEALKVQYEAADDSKRGLGHVLFGRIVARIRDLSRHYLEQETKEDLKAISALYSYVMVDHPELIECVRLYDHSIDHDGIIEEAFSEIGKTQIQALEDIYTSRASKIGKAMSGIHKVEYIMDEVMYANPSLPLGGAIDALDAFARAATRLCGFPATDYAAYDPAAAIYADAFDALYEAIMRVSHLNVSRGRSHQLGEWLHDGLKLIHSMQNIRDIRVKSIEEFRASASQWG